MALTTCPDCGREISVSATACPGCGRPMAPAEPQRVKTTEDSALTRNRGCGDILIFGVVAVVLLVILVILAA